MRELPRCGSKGCTGHLGKYESCLAEALHAASLDGGDLTTGTVDWAAHYTFMIFDQDTSIVDVSPPFTIPKGAYILGENDRGYVWINLQGSNVDEVREEFERIDALFGLWLSVNDDDPAGDTIGAGHAADYPSDDHSGHPPTWPNYIDD